MKIFGFQITRAKAAPVDSRGGWRPIVNEPYGGAWQNNDELRQDVVLGYFAVYACLTLISADIGKLPYRYKRVDGNGIWNDVAPNGVTRLLKRPNRYQNGIQFREWWVMSRASRGNTYALKERNARGEIVALYILDPERVTPLVAEDGSIYYQLNADNLNTLETAVVVPAGEIIHDRMNCMFHPLVGVSPLFACGLSADQGLRMQRDSRNFFSNGARPGGILTAPGSISDETAKRLKEHWDTNYTGQNAGRVAVVGDGLKFEPMRATSADSQLVEQMRLSAEVVCSTFHVPLFKLGIGSLPAGQKVDQLNQIYYSDCLQAHIESMELCLDEGLDVPPGHQIELDTEALLRMDTAAQYATLGEAVGGSIMAPNEARRRVNLPPLEGGNSIYMQMQNYSLEALARRDAQANPFNVKPEEVLSVDAAGSGESDAADAKSIEYMAFAAMTKALSRAAEDAADVA